MTQTKAMEVDSPTPNPEETKEKEVPKSQEEIDALTVEGRFII